MPLLLLGLGVLALGFAFASRGSAPSSAPASIVGLAKGAWYTLAIGSTFRSDVFGPDVAGQEAQAKLGRQGFDVRASAPNGSVTAYTVTGIYQGDSGTLTNPDGITLYAAAPALPIAGQLGGPQHIDARPVPVAPGTTYYGRASISWPLSMLVTHDAVVSKLLEHGFSDVSVWTSPGDLPADWPSNERGGDVFAKVTWPGDAGDFAVPSQVVSVWT